MKYIFSGTLPQNAPTYIERQADRKLYTQLKANQFCYVFNSRKMGKSSLRVRVMSRLLAEGFACAVIDLSLDEVQLATSEQWYFGIIYNLTEDLELDIDLDDWWDSQRLLSPLAKLRQFIKQVLLEQLDSNIVIFIDEIDSVLSLNFPTDDFFAFIRGCYNSRADHPTYNRLSFCLLGVANPSVLIEDRFRTPFNIGHSIELTGFTLAEAQPLIIGLKEKVAAPEKTLAELLEWTQGQPFLTQKLCHLIANNNLSSQPDIKQLVYKHVIENWEYQDEPEHLRTIRDRIVDDKKLVGKLLEIYQKILQHETINADDSPEAIQLKLSGLVVKRQNKLTIYNPIYKAIFDKTWITKELDSLRPNYYAKKLSAWLTSNPLDNSHLLDNQELYNAQEWAADKSLSSLDYQFLNTSLDFQRKKSEEEAEQILADAKKNAKRIKLLSFLLSLGAIVLGGWATLEIWNLNSKQYAELERRISIGEDILLNPNLDKRAGAKLFSEGKFEQSANKFNKSLQNKPNDPEALIYSNNARFASSNPLLIAVGVPIGKNQDVAQEMLRGVAQAQNEVNKNCEPAEINNQCGINGKPLQVKIVNDDNDPEIAKELAKQLVKDRNVLAIVGHNASDVSRAAANVYQSHLGMISPTSFSMDFHKIQPSKTNYIFRNVPGIRDIVKNLVKHIPNEVNDPKIVVCYDSDADDNKSFKEEFSKLKENIELVDLECDFSDSNFNYDKIIDDAIKQGANSLLLAPHVDRINEAIRVAKVNHKKESSKKLQLFSSPSLYTNKTLEDEEGREAVEGMQLAVAWHPDIATQSSFLNDAKELWKKEDLNYTIVTWRTAMSYDATQTIIKGLKQNPTRKGLQKALSDKNFFVNGATGKVEFENGERKIKQVLQPKEFLVEIKQLNESESVCDFVPVK